METTDYAEITECWVRNLVVGLNLCPFAAEPLRRGRIRYAVCLESETEAIFRSLLQEMEAMLRLPEAEVETSLFIVPHGLATFEAYLALLESAEDALHEVGLEGVFQLASFHPDYCFAGEDQNDPANYTNRSPFPMFHLIREASLERALENYPNPATIPLRNVEKLRELGLREIERLLRDCAAKQRSNVV